MSLRVVKEEVKDLLKERGLGNSGFTSPVRVTSMRTTACIRSFWTEQSSTITWHACRVHCVCHLFYCLIVYCLFLSSDRLLFVFIIYYSHHLLIFNCIFIVQCVLLFFTIFVAYDVAARGVDLGVSV